MNIITHTDPGDEQEYVSKKIRNNFILKSLVWKNKINFLFLALKVKQMKKIFLIPLICTPILLGFGNLEIKIEDKRIFQKQVELKPKPLDSLIEALIQVESSGDSLAVGDTHLGSPSIGVLQIRPVMVREVNRILQIQGCKERYKLKDRKSRKKSIEMFMIWYNFHHFQDPPEVVARNWNGGPNGYKINQTEKYWKKVKSKLNGINIR